jgi:hypothetical protein
MTPDRLLREVEGLRHDDRIRRLIHLGRQSREDPRLAATLEQMERGGFYERFLSLVACSGRRDAARVLRGLTDPSRTLRGRAARMIVLLGDDGEVLRGLTLVPAELRKVLLVYLCRARRHSVIDRWLATLAAGGIRDFDLLLPFGSASFVEKSLPHVMDRAGLVFWLRLARHHPRLAAKVLRQHVPAAGRADPRFAWLCGAVWPLLSRSVPDEALALAADLVRVVPPASLSWQGLIQRRPRQTADLLLSLRRRGAAAGSFNGKARSLGHERVLACVRKGLIAVLPQADTWSTTARPYRWLEALPQALRGAIFTAWRERHRRGTIDPGLLPLLPEGLRTREARRHLALPSLTTRPAERFPYAALLNWDTALALLDPFLKHPDADLRAHALRALARALPLQRERAAGYLKLVRARKNEQDPVRLAMLQALAGTPPVVWRAEHLEDLGAVVRDALDAADLSHATAGQANLLVLRQVRRHAEWAAQWLSTLVRERGSIDWLGLEALLQDDDVARIGAALLPILHAWGRRERDYETLQLASALGRRLRVFGALLDRVEDIVRTTRQSHLATWGLDLLRKHGPKRLGELVPRLLRADRSWITQATVQQHLHRRRQDLLTPFLGRQPIRGRFSTGKTRFVLPLEGGFVRWTASQQEAFAATLREVIADTDPGRDTPSIWLALRQLAALPAVPPNAVIARAGLRRRPAIRDVALRLLGRLDAGQGVPVLLEALEDDRARIAIYALRRALLEMPEAHALDLLRGVRRDRVTVAKEVVRLVGELDSDGALAFLEEVEGGAPHRDVRVALLRAVWTHLERPGAWAMIDRAVQAGDPALMDAVVRIPSDRLSSQARSRLAALLGNLLSHTDPSVRLAVLTRCVAEPPADPGQVLLPALLRRLASPLPDERAAAARAVVGACSSTDGPCVAQGVAELGADRHGLRELILALRSAVPGERRRLGPVARAVLAALADDPRAAAAGLPLALATLAEPQVRRLFLQGDAGGWRPDLLVLAAQVLQTGTVRMSRGDLGRLEAALAPSGSAALRRLALAALVAQTRGHGWDEGRLARLRAFRGDGDALVAEAAQWILPEEEETL